jgi:hypothetical protein
VGTTVTAPTITLPPGSTTGAATNFGKVYIIKDSVGTAATRNITITPGSPSTIDGQMSLVISINYGSVTLFCDGMNYFSTAVTTAAGGTAIVWNPVAGTTQAIAVNNGYYTTGATLCTLTLPATAAAGSVVEVAGSGTGLWLIAQNAAQQIIMGNQSTTAGTGGSLASTLKGDSVRMLVTTGGASTIWQVLDSFGNITVT